MEGWEGEGAEGREGRKGKGGLDVDICPGASEFSVMLLPIGRIRLELQCTCIQHFST